MDDRTVEVDPDTRADDVARVLVDLEVGQAVVFGSSAISPMAKEENVSVSGSQTGEGCPLTSVARTFFVRQTPPFTAPRNKCIPSGWGATA